MVFADTGNVESSISGGPSTDHDPRAFFSKRLECLRDVIFHCTPLSYRSRYAPISFLLPGLPRFFPGERSR